MLKLKPHTGLDLPILTVNKLLFSDELSRELLSLAKLGKK